MSISLYNKQKITIYNMNKMLIENYHQIVNYQYDYIVIDFIAIRGNNLHINEINDYNVEIIGEIKEIKAEQD